MRLEGRRGVITGAASGIGRASAERFAREGARLVLADLDGAGLEETARRIGAAGGEAVAVVADAASEEAVAGLVARCRAEFGGIDFAFANAGVAGSLTPVTELEVEEWRSVLAVNLLGPFLLIKHAAPPMREAGGGSIVCTASVAGLRSGAGPSPYSASKAGVISLVRTAANQLAGTGVRVNAVCPGLVETGMTRPLFEAARAAGKEGRIGQLNPLRRPGRPEEIAALALFLVSDESSYVNGQAMAVDGGLSSTLPFVPGRMT